MRPSPESFQVNQAPQIESVGSASISAQTPSSKSSDLFSVTVWAEVTDTDKPL